MTGVVHYGKNGYGECGAGSFDEFERGKRTPAEVTLNTADVTCRVCRGWLPIVAPTKEP